MEDCNSIITDNNGNTFFYGQTKDSTYFGSHLFRTQSNQMGIDGNYGYATFISKISSSGTWQFVKELCNASTNQLEGSVAGAGNPERLAVDDANNVYTIVDGEFENANPFVILGDTIFFGNGNTTDKYLVKLNNNGLPVWKHGIADVSSGLNSLIYANKQLYLAGFLAKDNRNADNSRSLIFSALTIPKNNPGNNYFIAKADTAGNFKWETDFSSDRGTFGNAVKYFNGNIYTAGSYIGGITSLGNLNGSFNSQTNISNIFFGKLKDQYIRVGAITPTTLTSGCNITIPFTAYNYTFSSTNKFTAELSDISGSFDNPTIIGSTTSTGSGSITATIPATLAYGSGYIVRIRSSDTLATGYNYYAYADTGYKLTLACPAPGGLSSTNITSTSAKLNWSVVICAFGYKIQYRIKGTSSWTTVIQNTNTGSYSVTGLIANTTYQWRLATKCKPQNTGYFSDYSGIKTFTTGAAGFAIYSAQTSTLHKNEIAVYPNPAMNTATVIFNTNKPQNYTLELSDISGKRLQLINKEAKTGENQVTFDISSYAQGMYLISLINDKYGKRTLKLNKQ